MSISHQLYSEMAQIRASAQQSARYQLVQTGIMCHMQGSLNQIGNTMIGLQRQNSDILAIQHELLERDQIQAELEEFIYKAEGLVKECSSKDTDIPYSSRYFLLMSVKSQIAESGLTTAFIRGRDNKSAFDKAVRNIDRLLLKLSEIKEVQEAIEWANQENDRRLEVQRKNQEEKLKQIAELQNQRAGLVSQLKTYTMMDSFKETIAKFESWGISIPKEGTPRKVIIGILVCIAPFFIMCVPIFLAALYIDSKQMEQRDNANLLNEIALIDQQIGILS